MKHYGSDERVPFEAVAFVTPQQTTKEKTLTLHRHLNMFKPVSALVFTVMAVMPVTAFADSTGSFSPCDLNQDGVINILDVQLAINMFLGVRPCTANIDGAGVCNNVVVQQVINATLGGACHPYSHTVTLNWTSSATPAVSYNVYRSTASNGPYTKLTSTPLSTVSYVDSSVVAGQTYYYVTTAVNSNSESAYSNQALAAVPFP